MQAIHTAAESTPCAKENPAIQEVKLYSVVALKLGPASKMPSPPQNAILQILPLLSYNTLFLMTLHLHLMQLRKPYVSCLQQMVPVIASQTSGGVDSYPALWRFALSYLKFC